MLAVPSVAHTKRLPGWVGLHVGMRVRLTTQVLPPWAVQDATGVIVEIDLSAQDMQRLRSSDKAHPASELLLQELPHGVYAKLDNRARELLPPVACQKRKVVGVCKVCAD